MSSITVATAVMKPIPKSLKYLVVEILFFLFNFFSTFFWGICMKRSKYIVIASRSINPAEIYL